MNLEGALHAAVEPHTLLDHSFYRAWNDGDLGVESLREYAAEYGVWIEALAEGWEAIGETRYAAEERRHWALWGEFAAALRVERSTPRDGVEALLSVARGHFEEGATAMGALYAFEIQQSRTARTKLRGLRRHYTLGRGAEGYFEAHLDDGSEAGLLLSSMTKLDRPAQERAIGACAETARALWNALDDFAPA